jgi:hypothetical protein
MNSPAVTGPTGSAPAVIDRIRRNLVGLKMPRALEILDVTLRGIERGVRSGNQGEKAHCLV